jgi:hypothetical protein
METVASEIRSESSTKQVLDHHLGAFAQGLDEILKDYDAASTLITPDRTYRGVAEISAFFKAFLDSATPEFWDAFKIISLSVSGDIAYLAWEAKPRVAMATDTLYIKNGKISVQTFTALSA